LLDKAIAADDSLLQALNELDFAQRELSKVVTDYNRFLDERLLWVRTGDPPSWEMLESVKNALVIFVTAQNWVDLGQALFRPKFFPWALLIGVLLFALLVQQTRRLRGMLRRSGRNVGQLRHDRFYDSIKAASSCRRSELRFTISPCTRFVWPLFEFSANPGGLPSRISTGA